MEKNCQINLTHFEFPKKIVKSNSTFRVLISRKKLSKTNLFSVLLFTCCILVSRKINVKLTLLRVNIGCLWVKFRKFYLICVEFTRKKFVQFPLIQSFQFVSITHKNNLHVLRLLLEIEISPTIYL